MKLFLVSPIFAYIKALINPSKSESKSVILLFCILYGFIMSTTDQSLDLYYYLHVLEDPQTDLSVLKLIKNLEVVDLYSLLSMKIVSFFTNNGHILMAWFGMFYGLFLIKGLKYWESPKNTIAAFLILLFYVNAGLHVLAGVRNITAFFLFFWGVNTIIFENKSKGIYILLCSMFVHFSYIMFCTVFVLYFFLQNKPRICLLIFLLSFVLSIPSISEEFIFLAGLLGGEFLSRAETYSTTNVDYVNFLNESYNEAYWYIKYKTDILLCGFLIFFLIVFLFRKQIIVSDRNLKYLNFLLLLFAFRNLVLNIPDVGARTTTVCCHLATFATFLIYKDNIKFVRIKQATAIMVVLAVLSIAYSARMFFGYTHIWEVFVTPVFTVPYKIIEYFL